MAAAPEAAREAVARLAEECRQCYQCGQCTAACPSGWDLDHGPRWVVRLVLSGDVEALLACDDVWRCSECGACTRACPMEVDAAAALALVRELQRDRKGVSCPERLAADVARRHLERRPRIDNLTFGMAMVSRGAIPKDVVGSAIQGSSAARSVLGRAASQLVKMSGAERRWPRLGAAGRPSGGTSPAKSTEPSGVPAQPFFTGCVLPQDPETYRRTREVAAALDVRLAESPDAGCCGHPARGARPATFKATTAALTVCPACDASLREAGQETTPLWEALTEKARREDRRLKAAAPAFVPYVGCLGERERSLAALADAAALAGVEMRRSFPSLHSACCGALGGMFRGETKGARRLLDYAAAAQAPVVTTCLLCRDNLRSAARRRRLPVDIRLWPEFFEAADDGTDEPPVHAAAAGSAAHSVSAPARKDDGHD